MPRKTRRTRKARPPVSTRFNEAAARCRGKRPLDRPGRLKVGHASMRPRPDAAENNRIPSDAAREEWLQ